MPSFKATQTQNVAVLTQSCSQTHTVCFSVRLITLGIEQRDSVLSVPINIHIQGWSDLLWQKVNFILKLIMLNPWENNTHAVWLAVGAVRTFRMCKEK